MFGKLHRRPWGFSLGTVPRILQRRTTVQRSLKLAETLIPISTSSSRAPTKLVFSLVSLWEIAIQIRTGKLNALRSSVAYIRQEMEAYGMELLPIRYDHILQLESLPHHHGDPFDRLLIAQALTESLPVVTGDKIFKGYGVKVIW